MFTDTSISEINETMHDAWEAFHVYRKLPLKARATIKDTDNKCYISIASIWEIAIKMQIGKLNLQSGFDSIQEFLDENQIEILSIEFQHIQQLLKLKFHHRDPFDRIIIAQGLQEKLLVISKDENFSKYKIKLLWN